MRLSAVQLLDLRLYFHMQIVGLLVRRLINSFKPGVPFMGHTQTE